RYDAIWGVNARAPEFAKEMRLALKSIKPEILMLADDKATWSATFNESFDVGFDWFAEEGWVSHWTFQTFYSEASNPTIFNSSNQNNRAFQLRNALTNFGNGYSPNAKILRFIGNNDIYHFMTHHGEERTKMVATLIFALNGIPLVYNGQEIGAQGHPYGTEFIFLPGPSIKAQDPYGFYELYKKLAEIRTSSPALYSENFEEIDISPNDFTFAFRRWNNNENVIGLINMGDQKVDVNLSLPVDEMTLDSSESFYLTDLINGEYYQTDFAGLKNFSIPIEKYRTRIFSLADTIATVVSIKSESEITIPKAFSVSQNYPNPFNPTTKIIYNLPESGNVRIKVYDSIGREVKLLLDKVESTGTHFIEFDGSKISSGVYFYRVEYNNHHVTKKMILIE
ncbi:MAG: T9SS type A sorting domain-containing protein, partial [Melioribacteraceae bacterium]|nr:T9SS type A sorting domain-containing protein [Melioribacteraceae bacterium]